MTGPNLNYDIPAIDDPGPGWGTKLIVAEQNAEVAAHVSVRAKGAVPGGGDASGAFSAAYSAATATDGAGVMDIEPGVYLIASDLHWDLDVVSVKGAGSGLVTLQMVGTAKLVIRPSTFTVTQGPRVGGFTVQADPAAPAGTIGIDTGDITNYHFDDIVVQGYTAGAVGVINKALAANVATLMTQTAHGYTAGHSVTVMGIGDPFNGVWTIATTPTSATFTYACTHADVASTAIALVGGVAAAGANSNGSIAIRVPTARQTELNTWSRIHLNNNAVGIDWTNSDPALNSLARNKFYGFHMNCGPGQIGWRMAYQVVMYGAVLNLGGNMAGAGMFFCIGYGTTDACGINGGEWALDLEQTSGAGGTPFAMGLNGYAFPESGYDRFSGFAAGSGITPPPRPTLSWRRQAPTAISPGEYSPPEGTIANFMDSGHTVGVFPMMRDSVQFASAAFEFFLDPDNSIHSAGVTIFDAPDNIFGVFKTSGAPNDLTLLSWTTSGGVLTAVVGLRSGIFTTTQRNALTVPQATTVYDSTLMKNVTFDGTNWRDAMANIV